MEYSEHKKGKGYSRKIEEMHNSWKETEWRQHMEQMSRIREQAILKIQNILCKRPGKEPAALEGSWEEDTVREKVSIFSLCYMFRNPFSSTTIKDENPIRTLEDYSKPSHEGYRNTIELPVRNNVVSLRSDTIRLVQNGCSFHGHQSEDPNQHLKDFLKLMDSFDLDGENKERTRTIDQSAGGKLRDHNVKEYWALLEDLALYYNESCNDPRDFAKPIKAITLPQDVPSTFDRRLIKLETQGQRLMEAHLGLTQPTQVNKITTSCKICNCPHDTQYCMEYPKQAFVDYASSRTDEVRGRVKGMHVFVGNFIYVVDVMIVEDISSIIDPSLSQVVLGRPFIKVSNMTHDLREGVVRFTNVNDEVAYKMPHKIEQYNSLSNLEKEHKKLVYLRNEEDKRRGVDYVMSKILGFYKECLELDPEYVTGLDDEGEDT
uniref:MAK10-like protein n=1 Tax=Tanacetum cinerariifolium TaxID=118510 RepID=A0A6L2KHX3_TANCI|nr:MAK10-like protein [Tanacetum cinerariifolium]